MVTEGVVPIQLGGFVPRATLAILVLHANTVVPASLLLESLWPRGVPSTGKKMLQNAISAIRRGFACVQRDDETSLVTQAPGYLLRVDPEQVDLLRFQRLLAEGRLALAAGKWELAARTLRRALLLWRGPMLADLVERGVSVPEIASLDNERLAAVEDRFDAELACGRHLEIVAELEAMVLAEPLRERLCGQLMMAHYRAGRQVDALGDYRAIRDEMADRQGIDPSPALQQLHEMILRHDPQLHVPAASTGAAAGGAGLGADQGVDPVPAGGDAVRSWIRLEPTGSAACRWRRCPPVGRALVEQVDFVCTRTPTLGGVERLAVGEVAERFGVTKNTLRYYESVGLLDPVERDAAGHRIYDEHAMACVVFVTRLRATGMSIRKLREYMDLARAGDHTAEQRRQILQEHRASLHTQRADIDACLEVIDNKIRGYGRLMAVPPAGKAS
ncbi:Bacterial transcriptional activator domain protein [Kutzneria sp. CA-103260]|nr:Bacterial transcriptional activator domain protein [Kutzneria sp. CA-103260]